MKIAIVGFAKDSYGIAPWDDPEWEKWGLPWDITKGWQVYDRLFEMHDKSLLDPPVSGSDRPEGYYKELLPKIAKEKILYMNDPVEGAIKYPFDVGDRITGGYYGSSMSYLLALAISYRPTDIGIYGVNMAAQDEWIYQRSSFEFLLGICKGLGINLHMPDTTPLLKFQDQYINFGKTKVYYTERYGNPAKGQMNSTLWLT